MKSTSAISTLIVDDEQDAIDVLSYVIDKYCPELEVVATARSAATAIEKINQFKPALLLLDINIGSTSGGKNIFDVLPDLPKYPFEIVFVTAYDQFAIRAIKLHAFDYLLKPVDAREMMGMAQKLAARADASKLRPRLESLAESQSGKEAGHSIWLPVKSGIRKTEIEKIVWVKAEEHYTRICIEGGEVLFTNKSFKEVKEMLDRPGFFCTHRSYLIQLGKVSEVCLKGDNQVVMEDGSSIPVARNRKKAFESLLPLK